MARKLYGGYGIGELRRWARDLGVKGRSTMDGHALLAACRETNAEKLYGEEIRVKMTSPTGTVAPGMLVTQKCGCVIEATTEVRHESFNFGDNGCSEVREYVHGLYREMCPNCAATKEPVTDPDRLAYFNRQWTERDLSSVSPYRFFLWSSTKVADTFEGASA